jgi:hypothetical protein
MKYDHIKHLIPLICDYIKRLSLRLSFCQVDVLNEFFQTPIAIAGVVCNLATCLVLASKDMRNSFNLVSIVNDNFT